MNKTAGLVLSLAALLVIPACGDDDPDNTDNPAFASAFPDNGFVNRTTEVALIGIDTAWTSSSTIDFGAGITVSDVQSVGPTGLIVTLTIAADAEEGMRDISVDGETLPGGFTLAQPIEVTIEGTVAQGSILSVTIKNNDIVNPFNTELDPETEAPLTTLLTTAANVTPFNPTIGASEISSLIGLDLNVAPGEVVYSLNNNGIIDTFTLDVAARTAEVADFGTALGGTIDAFGSHIFQVDIVTGESFQAQFPEGLIYLALDSTGSFANILNLGFFGLSEIGFTAEADETLYLVVWDSSVEGTGGGAFSLPGAQFAADPANALTAAEGGNTVADAQVLAAYPALISGATMADDADEDWFTVTVPAGDAGLGLVVTTDGESGGDTVVAVFEADGTTLVAQTDDLAFYDSLITPAVVAGDYQIRITNSPENVGADPALEYTVLVGVGSPL